MPTQVLVVDDEPTILDNISYALQTESMKVSTCVNLSEARQALRMKSYDAMVLDVSLPDGNGFDFCKEIRSFSKIPILFLTARADEIDRVVGLEIGADDYVVKPFSPRELGARIRAILRRVEQLHFSHEQFQESTKSKSFFVDDEAKSITFEGIVLELSRYEYRLLKLLIDRPSRVFSRDELMDYCWEDPSASLDRTVDTHIKKIRNKLKNLNSHWNWIKTHRGMGYSFNEKHG